MRDKDSISKINKSKISKKNKQVKLKINYKNKYKEALEKINNLEINLIEQKRENQINIDAFREKAKGFQKKAQEKIENFKKDLNEDIQKEKDYIKKYGSQKMLESSLEILLNIEVAIKSGETDDNVSNYVKGFKMLMNQLYDNLEQYGVKKISPQINEDFNSQLHYAVETCSGEKNKIIKIQKEGFTLYDRVIKPATVVIGK